MKGLHGYKFGQSLRVRYNRSNQHFKTLIPRPTQILIKKMSKNLAYTLVYIYGYVFEVSNCTQFFAIGGRIMSLK